MLVSEHTMGPGHPGLVCEDAGNALAPRLKRLAPGLQHLGPKLQRLELRLLSLVHRIKSPAPQLHCLTP